MQRRLGYQSRPAVFRQAVDQAEEEEASSYGSSSVFSGSLGSLPRSDTQEQVHNNIVPCSLFI